MKSVLLVQPLAFANSLNRLQDRRPHRRFSVGDERWRGKLVRGDKRDDRLHATAERDHRYFDTLGSERIAHEVGVVGPKTFIQEIDSGGSTGNNSVRLPVLLHSLAGILTRISDDFSHRTRHVQQQHTRTAGFGVAGEPDISEGLLFCHRHISSN